MLWTTDIDSHMLGVEELPKQENITIQVSQSLIKNLDKEYCPRRLYEQYILGKEGEATESMQKGILFEYYLNGSTGIHNKKPLEPVMKNGKRYVDYERIEQQARRVGSLLSQYDFCLDDQIYNVEISTMFEHPDMPQPIIVRGRIDQIATRKGKLCIIDYKLTKKIDSDHSLYSWKSPSTMNHTQAYMYMWLYMRNREINPNGTIPQFYYAVFEYDTKMDYEIIQVEWDATKIREIEYAIVNSYHKMLDEQGQGWPVRPAFYECLTCPIKNSCKQRKKIKDIKLV